MKSSQIPVRRRAVVTLILDNYYRTPRRLSGAMRSYRRTIDSLLRTTLRSYIMLGDRFEAMHNAKLWARYKLEAVAAYIGPNPFSPRAGRQGGLFQRRGDRDVLHHRCMR